MEIYFVRHGETMKNREKRLQGRSDEPLSEAGRMQAETVRDFLKAQGTVFDRVYSSPLLRAVQTAEIIAGDEAIIPDARLLEMDYGPYEGTRLDQLPPELAFFFRDFARNPAPEGMESLADVTLRMRHFLEDMKSVRAEHILVATHAIALKGALEALTRDANGAWWSRYISTCAVFRTALLDGEFTEPKEIFSLKTERGV